MEDNRHRAFSQADKANEISHRAKEKKERKLVVPSLLIKNLRPMVSAHAQIATTASGRDGEEMGMETRKQSGKKRKSSRRKQGQSVGVAQPDVNRPENSKQNSIAEEPEMVETSLNSPGVDQVDIVLRELTKQILMKFLNNFSIVYFTSLPIGVKGNKTA